MSHATRYLGTQDGEDTEVVGRDELLHRVEAGEAIVALPRDPRS